ncbi:MAG: FkbM family methyltransferase [Gloeomargarita sp. DG02_4_bins_56]
MPLCFTPLLKAQGYLDQVSITLANVGSRKVHSGDDFGRQGWSIFAPNLTIYGFDADADACEAANALLAEQGIPWQETHIPLALSDTVGTKTLYVTHEPMCSSLYPPNEPYLQRFYQISQMMALDFTVEVETTTLDIFFEEAGVNGVDYLRTDVQGADLDVFRGAQKLLEQSLLVAEMEVIFSPLYVGQPLFADLDIFMRSQGFTLMELGLHPGVTRRVFPMTTKPIYYGQKLWGDAVYIRDLLAPETPEFWRTPGNIFKLACIMDVLNYHDYAAELLLHLVEVHHWPLAELMHQAIRDYAPEELWPKLPLLDDLAPKTSSGS